MTDIFPPGEPPAAAQPAPFTDDEINDVLTAVYEDGRVDLVLADRIAAVLRLRPPAAQPVTEPIAELKRVLPEQKRMAENVIGLAGSKPADDAYFRGKADGIQQVIDSIAFIEERSEVQPPAAAPQETEHEHEGELCWTPRQMDAIAKLVKAERVRLQSAAAAHGNGNAIVRDRETDELYAIALRHTDDGGVTLTQAKPNGVNTRWVSDALFQRNFEPLQPAAAAHERAALSEMTSALKGFVEWHGGAHVGPCPEDDTCDCQGKPYNDAVNEAVRKADAILSLQPAAAATPIDLLVKLIATWRDSAAWEMADGSSEFGKGRDQCADELEAELARLRALQGTEQG